MTTCITKHCATVAAALLWVVAGACHDPTPGTVLEGSVGGGTDDPVRLQPSDRYDKERDDPGCTVPVVDERFDLAQFDAVDILLVVDDSGSMNEEQANLGQNFSAFINEAPPGVNYRIGVTTTSLENGGKLEGYPPVIDPTSAGSFLGNALVGTLGSGTEQGLAAARLSLEGPFGSYLRPAAMLVIIIVSDEDDQSSGALDSYVATFKAFKAEALERLRFFAIIGGPDGCETNDGFADPANRYLYVVDALDGDWASICDASFGESLRAFGQGTFIPRTEFHLSYEPVIDTLEVRLNGQELPPEEWEFDAQEGMVKLLLTTKAGDRVNIGYERPCALE